MNAIQMSASQSGLKKWSISTPSSAQGIWVKRLSQPEDALYFSGDSRSKKSLKTRLYSALILGASLAGILPGVAKASPSIPINGTPAVVCIDEAAHPVVNSAQQLSFLNSELRTPIIDLCNNPLLSETTRQELNQLLLDVDAGPLGQGMVLVIPDTQQAELNSLAADLFNQVGLGHAGKNDGVLLLLNAASLRENRDYGRMHLMPGYGVETQLGGQKAVDILIDHALPHLQTASELSSLEAKQPHFDAAVKETVQAIKTVLEASAQPAATAPLQQSTNSSPSTTQPSTQNTDPTPLIVGGLFALFVLAAVITAIGSSTQTSTPSSYPRRDSDTGWGRSSSSYRGSSSYSPPPPPRESQSNTPSYKPSFPSFTPPRPSSSHRPSSSSSSTRPRSSTSSSRPSTPSFRPGGGRTGGRGGGI